MLTKRLIAGIVFFVAAAGSAVAHHSFVAEYDIDQPIVLGGTVTKIEWTNPHAWIFMEAMGPDGTLAEWEVELGSPNTLIRYGWNRNKVQIGETLTVDGYLSRDGLKRINSKIITLADGSRFEAGSSALQPTR